MKSLFIANNKLKIFLKEFLGFGILTEVFLAILLCGSFALSHRLSGEYSNVVAFAFYSLFAVVLYFFAKKLDLTSRRAVFYRVFFWVYFSILILILFVFLSLLSSLKGVPTGLTVQNILALIFGPIPAEIVFAGIISFLAIPPRRKSNG